MLRRVRIHRPSPAMIVALLALLAAVGGTAVAGGVLNKKKVNRIITNRAPGLAVASAKNADSAKSADNAEKLAGVAASGYQRSCKAGSIKASLVVDTSGAPATFTNEPGFNCFQPGNTSSSVQLKRTSQGNYQVRFVGNTGPDATGSAVCSAFTTNNVVSCQSAAGGSDAPGETVFNVHVTNLGGVGADGQSFSLLAF